MTYEDIVEYVTDSNNIPPQFREYQDLLNWCDNAIPNWRSMPQDKQNEVKRTFAQTAGDNLEQDIQDLVRRAEQLPPDYYESVQKKSFITKFLNKVGKFLGRLF
jgi:uncharacterized protein YaaN involved in tellurite resistance